MERFYRARPEYKAAERRRRAMLLAFLVLNVITGLAFGWGLVLVVRYLLGW